MSTQQKAQNPQDVRKRRVFYIPGYDPMLPRRYRELYRSEASKQALWSGYGIELKGKAGKDNYGWSVRTDIDGRRSRADFEFLGWSDIVQKSMNKSIPATYFMMLHTVWIYLSSGTLLRLARLRKGPIVAALFPVVALCAQLLLGLGLAWAVAALAGIFIAQWLGWGFGLVFGGLLMRWFKARDNRIFAYYLLHDYAFSAQYYGVNPPALEVRMQEFKTRIAAALSSDADEVLLVGHSSGAHIGASVLADLLRERPLDSKGPRLAFLSLGQVIPMVSFLPRATRLRGDLRFLSQRDDIDWVDVSAPGDGCSFALCDPVSVSGVAPAEGRKRWPLVFSAAFSETLSPALFKSLKRRFFRIHFQYLCAFDRPRDYDYFQITAGPLSLRARYKDRVASRSRIEVPLSTHRSTDREDACAIHPAKA